MPAGRSLVPVPLPEVTSGRTGMRWAALSGLEFPVPRGYFMGPADPPADRTGSWNAPPRYTSDLLARVGRDGLVPVITAADRQASTRTCGSGGPGRWCWSPAKPTGRSCGAR